MARLATLFPGLAPSPEAELDLSALGEMASQFGNLGDEIIALHLLEELDKNKKAKAKRLEIKYQWAEMKEKIQSKGIKEILQRL